jgi:hypothetical protein
MLIVDAMGNIVQVDPREEVVHFGVAKVVDDVNKEHGCPCSSRVSVPDVE